MSLPSFHYQQLTTSMVNHFPKLPHLVSIARFDKPIGIYLLLWPTLWALWISAEGFPGWHLLTVFVLGTILTRSAGCVINDIADRNFDGQVARTKNRPLVSGQLALIDAFIFLGLLTFLALLLVLSTNLLTVGIAIIGALIASIYPFMKRYTYLPQVVLGIAFSCGIPMAFAATQGSVPQVAWLLMISNLVWTVGYDTEYAMVDRDDDIRLGLKSSAILFADMDKLAIASLQILFLATLLLTARSEAFTYPFYIGLALAFGLLSHQQFLIRDRQRDKCFQAFRNNHWVGFVIFLGIFGHYSMR